MAVFGLGGSFAHAENGMTERDMATSASVADRLDEVIVFRSTGPWSMRWIELHYPTKNFHVKGKSSDWGPQAGFVPYLGKHSKVGHDATEAADGTKANDDGLAHKYAGKTRLTLTRAELQLQATKEEEQPPRRAVHTIEPVPRSEDFFLFARRSGDGREFAFRAVKLKGDAYEICAYGDGVSLDRRRLLFEKAEPLEVMTSSELGAGNRPMTGDYDLMAVCPRWGDLNSASVREITKPGLNFAGAGQQAGLTFAAGANLDRVLEMRTNTGARPAGGNLKQTFQGLTKRDGGALDEHGDMGNLTPRILRCVNELNAAMGATGPLRRVHHNAESHRNHIFGALTSAQMAQGSGFPLTVFQPQALCRAPGLTAHYTQVSTLETLADFKEYAGRLHKAGYFVPRNWTWGMSVRDRGAAHRVAARFT